jgi:hypothetical protein
MSPLELLPSEPLLAGAEVPLEPVEDVAVLLDACVLVAADDVPDDTSGPDVPLEACALEEPWVEDAVTALLLVSCEDDDTVTPLLLGGAEVEEVATLLLWVPETPPDDDDEEELLEELDEEDEEDVEAGPASSTGEVPTKHAEHPAPRKRPPNTMLPSTRRMSNLRRS